MKKIYQLAAALALATPIVFPTANQATAQTTEEQQTKEDLSTRVKKLHNYVLQKEKGDYTATDLEQGRIAATRFVYENTGYALLAMGAKKQEGAVTSEELADGLIIITHKLGEDQGIYTAFASSGDFGSLSVGQSLSYTLQKNEELLPSKEIFMGPPLTNEQVTERKTYVSGTGDEAQGEEYKESFETEFDRTIDELLKFYESD